MEIAESYEQMALFLIKAGIPLFLKSLSRKL
jgi:hypothetical protein